MVEESERRRVKERGEGGRGDGVQNHKDGVSRAHRCWVR